MKKLNCSKIREFIRDETIGAKDYISYGLPNLARDEKRHKIFLKKKLKNCLN
jgi:hypothetical protein